jgi:hypothetical protein
MHPGIERARFPDGQTPIVNLLGRLKVRVTERLLLGLAAQVPTAGRRDFSLQLMFQPDSEWITE